MFRYLYGSKQYYVKRIIGLPGEMIQIKDGVIFINGERLAENYGAGPIEDARHAAEPVVLEKDEP